MGYGVYSEESRTTRSFHEGYSTKSAQEIFTSRAMHPSMNPYQATMRESRDSNEHPNSVPIIFALDVTGSMGSIPHKLIVDGLPTIMSTIIKAGILDPQLMFLAIGDHVYDTAPLQVSQFESNDELLDRWLTRVWVEEGGGGNEGESYSLAHYFAAYHTSLDSFEKRGQKGFLFTVGDEPTLKEYPKRVMDEIIGNGETRSHTYQELLDKARETYHVYHLHVREGSNGKSERVMSGWREMLGESLIIVENKNDIPVTLARIVAEVSGRSTTTSTNQVSIPSSKEEMQML